MFKIDKKDLEILYQLDINSRQSLRLIGDKVRLKKNVVQYRIEKLLKLGIIKNFYTSINFYKLGFINLGIDVSYQYYTPYIEREIIQHFMESNYSWFIANVQGNIDLIVLFSIRNMNQFFSFWKMTLKKFRYNIKNANISFFTRTHFLPYSYLLEKIDILNRKKYEIIDGGEQIIIDEKDFKILQRISQNSRASLIDIAKEFDVTSSMIANRLKKLEKIGIINGYRINIDYSKLGLQLLNVKYTLKNYEKLPRIIEYVKNNSNLISVSEVIGNWDLSLNYHIRNYNSLHQIINDILERFSNDIKDRMTFSYPEIYKYKYIPNLKI
jgi:Lrp/AsnC family leucine-responsive transcriptional regulator